ncbi:MAG: hypothetical protein R3C27_00955 [Hyphomonadaceae bacterium]
MIFLILGLVYLGNFNPSWMAYVIMAVTFPFVEIVAVSIASGRESAGAGVIINALLFVVLGAIVVTLAKRARERDARELELLLRLTQKPPAD